jgi:hypothetical protein
MSSTLAQKRALIQNDLAEIKQLIKRAYPEAIFRLFEDTESGPRSLWMNVYANGLDGDDLTDLILERAMQLLEKKRFLLTVHARPLAYLPAPRARRAANGNRTARERRATYRVKSSRRKAPASS